MPSRGSGLAVAAARTTFSPEADNRREPPACLASFPVSNEISLPPERWTVTLVASGFMIHSFEMRQAGAPSRENAERPGHPIGAGLRRGISARKTHVWRFPRCWTVSPETDVQK
jgi:hypothetical protein